MLNYKNRISYDQILATRTQILLLILLCILVFIEANMNKPKVRFVMSNSSCLCSVAV